jgi:hypothetical protein
MKEKGQDVVHRGIVSKSQKAADSGRFVIRHRQEQLRLQVCRGPE